jgi:hypothetical protein
MPVTVRGTDILFNDGSTQSTAATGASTTFGAVGTYVMAGTFASNGTVTLTSGATYTPGTAQGQIRSVATTTFNSGFQLNAFVNNLSGTWRYMSGTGTASAACFTGVIFGLFVRIA